MGLYQELMNEYGPELKAAECELEKVASDLDFAYGALRIVEKAAQTIQPVPKSYERVVVNPIRDQISELERKRDELKDKIAALRVIVEYLNVMKSK